MILDTLKNSKNYVSVHPLFAKAFAFLAETDLTALPTGKIELDGANLFVSVQEVTGKTEDVARMETHNNYIDIQVPLDATETMGYTPTAHLQQVTQPYNAEKDITFFADKAETLLNVKPFEMAIFFPEDGHQPCIATGVYRKIVVKVRV
ncbi:MAG: YhcH/YjgK/YiaL family protein [Paludibacter sp.]|jgi:YhcH/YjgK/YiaL family protein|nr:YhcH/YjgK/YiaL family protein [Paludibacter sp.]